MKVKVIKNWYQHINDIYHTKFERNWSVNNLMQANAQVCFVFFFGGGGGDQISQVGNSPLNIHHVR